MSTNNDTYPVKATWFPLESNPQLMNDYIRKLGFDTTHYEFCDVFSTEKWALDTIPQPVVAVLFLYPLTPTKPNPQDEQAWDTMQDHHVWFIKQRIGNSCGTIALLHAIMNVPETTRIFEKDSWLVRFSNDCPMSLSPVQKAERLERDSQISQYHDDATSSDVNSTSRGDINDRVITHFASLVNVRGRLYELDGRKDGPVRHCPTTQATFLHDACAVVKKKMDDDPSETRFAIIALAPKEP